MKFVNPITNKGRKFLIMALSAILFISIAGITSKCINAYNYGIYLRQSNLKSNAGANVPSMYNVYVCLFSEPQSVYFVPFSIFIFLACFWLSRILKTRYLSKLSTAILLIWLADFFVLKLLFLELTNTQWNSKLTKFDFYDLALWIAFLTVSMTLTIIILRFAVGKFQDKISLR